VIALGLHGADVEVRGIRKGQVTTFEADDGFCHEPAPCDGLLVETRTATILVPLTELERALADLRAMRCADEPEDGE
jgi:hypothetical protein